MYCNFFFSFNYSYELYLFYFFLFSVLLALSDYGFCSDDKMSIDLLGYIEPKCSIKFDNSEINFSSKYTVEKFVNLSCNTKMTLRIQSKNGGLVNRRSPEIKESLVPYQLKFVIDSIPEFYIEAISESLTEGEVFRSNNKIPFDSQAKLLLSLVSPMKYAGVYTDQIWISVNPDTSQGGP